MNTAISRSDGPADSVPGAAERPALITVLLAGGVIGPILFLVAVLIEGATFPGYNAWHHPVSTLAIGQNGWIQTVNFVVCGVLVLGCAAGLRWAIHPGTGSTWVPILVGVCGLSLVAAAIFPTDPAFGYPPGAPSGSTLHGTIHAIASNIGPLALIVAAIVLARRFAATPGWRGWAVYSIATVVLLIVTAVASTLAASPDAPFGLIQRLTIAVGWVWIAAIAGRLLITPLPAGR